MDYIIICQFCLTVPDFIPGTTYSTHPLISVHGGYVGYEVARQLALQHAV